MGLIRPATPGFIVTLVATILLAVVSFCVPYFKSVYFLKANISINNVNGSITFGTLGYCLELSNGTTCSTPSVGYQLDINALVGNKLPVEIPQVAVKWLTYALVLHIVALGLSAASALFGLLAHVREMSMTCCSTFVSGFAAAVAMLAFIFDLALFFVAKARISAVGSAEMGNAIWLTLAAWLLLFFSGCFYTIGRCCITKRRPRGGDDWDKNKDRGESGAGYNNGNGNGNGGHAEQMRLDAVKAEADRKARQKTLEVGLPAFHEVQPLTSRVDDGNTYGDVPYQDHAPSSPAGYGRRPSQSGGYVGGGYVQAPIGSRAVDEYYAPTNNAASTYPPAPQQQPRRQASGYAPSSHGSTYTTSSPPVPVPTNQYLSTAPQQYTSGRYDSPSHDYGHNATESSYHTTAAHQQHPTSYSQYDPYDSRQPPHAESAFNPDTYNNTALLSSPPVPAAYPSSSTQYYSPQSSIPPTQIHPERGYTLGGDGYGANAVPPLPDQHYDANTSYFPYPGDTHTAPAPIITNTGYVSSPQTSPVRGPRPQRTISPTPDDAPPGYDAGTSNVTGNWGKR